MSQMIDSLVESLYAVVKKSPTDYSTLETTMGPRTFVYRNGSLSTVLRYEGVSKIVGPVEIEQIVSKLVNALNPFFQRKVHELQLVMDRDTMPKARMVKRMAPMYDTAKRLHLDEVMHDIFDEQAATMAARTMEDTITIVLYTHATAIRPEDYKEWVRQLTEERRKGRIHVPIGTQDETFGIDPLLALHDAFVDQVNATLHDSDVGGQVTVLNAQDATNVLAKSIDPLGTSDEWRAWMLAEADSHLARRMYSEVLTRNPTEAIRKENPKVMKIANTSIFFPPPLNQQLICQEANYPKTGYLEYAGRLYATLGMVIPPRRMVASASLVHSLSGMQARAAGGDSERVPYRLSIRLRGNGLQGALRATIAPLVSFGSFNNVKLIRAYKALQKEQADDMACASISLSLTTWVNANDPKKTEKLKSRVVAVRSAASQWGDMTVVEDTLDRFKALINSCPGLTLEPASIEAVGSLRELLPLLPWGRPASPLGSYGTELYRSLDGAILPLAAHSAEQDYWLETMTAPMGGGKSAQANRKHLDYIFAPGRTSLPFLHIIDIGGSVSGMVEMIQDALPADQKHQALLHVLRNDRNNAVNMLDTKLGLRHPLEGDLQATVDWLTSLVTPAERSKPYENMGEFCKAVLKALYKRLDDGTDNSQPRIYKRGSMAAVDQALDDARIDIQPGTPWFGVADSLGAKGNISAALIAHRMAMPLLSDLAAIANDGNIRGDYMAATTETGTPIPDAFAVQLALARESYPIFTDTTVLDLRGRRITAIDLQEAATKGNASARKQASLMYQVAYELFCRNIRITPDDLPLIPRVWRGYYANLIEELTNSDKHVSIDEYHRTQIQDLATKDAEDHDITGIRQTLVREGGRESRKWGLSLLTISQLSADHGKLFALASGNHIIKRGSQDETEFQRKALSLSPSDMASMHHFVNGPTKEGVTFLTQWTTKNGKFNQLFTSTLGPKTLWSLSTTFEDKTIRKIVFEALGRQAGRAVLARSFPKGSAKEEVDRRKRAIQGDIMDDQVEGACREVANELIAQYRANPLSYQ